MTAPHQQRDSDQTLDLTGEPVDAIETHISEVFLGSHRVYKRLKPVHLPFVDFTNRETRLAAADHEIELNRRMNPDVYEGTADVVVDGEVVDRLIVMKRLPKAAGLANFADHDDFDGHLDSVARAIATFHLEQKSLRGAAATPANADSLLANWQANLTAIAQGLADVISPEELEEVRASATRYLAGRRPVFEAREQDGWIRDGHGDLRCEHVFCLPDGPRFIDCLAFADRYRIGDVLNDVAFLAMDLHRLVGPHAALHLLSAYDQFTNERHPGSLAHHFVAYRASVRAKVAAIRVAQGDLTAASIARGYFELMRDHLRRSTVRLVIVGGAPGVGKSTVASGLADELGYVWLRSDEIRKDLAGMSHDEHAFDEPYEGIYSHSFSSAVYMEMLREAELLLQMGESVVLDASWASAADREAARKTASATSSDLVEVHCILDPATAKERIARRLSSLHNPSDATPAVADRVRASFDEWPEAARVATDGTVPAAVRDAIAAVFGDPHLEPASATRIDARFTELVLFAEASNAMTRTDTSASV